MKALILLILVFISISLPTFAQTKIVELKSDKAIYTVGETAILRANFLSKPDNSDFEFDLVGSLNGISLPVDRVTDFQMFSTVKNLQAGNHTWNVTVVIQDARYARDLKTTIAYYSDLIINLNEQIAVETDPVKLAQLQKRKEEAISLKSAAFIELNNIRTPVLAPITLQFTVE